MLLISLFALIRVHSWLPNFARSKNYQLPGNRLACAQTEPREARRRAAVWARDAPGVEKNAIADALPARHVSVAVQQQIESRRRNARRNVCEQDAESLAFERARVWPVE